jgi:hypothetical protein
VNASAVLRGVVSKSRIIYRPREDATTAEATLAACYRFILFESKASKKGTRPGAPDDDAKESNGCIAYPNHNK